MVTFIVRLDEVASNTLQVFDRFVLIEDLLTGEVEDAYCLTMREMLKEAKRRSGNVVEDPHGPFSVRQWPPLSMLMTPLANAPRPAQTSPASAEVSGRRSKSKRHHHSKDKNGKE